MEQIERFIKHWMRAVILMLAGAVLGYILWMFLPQYYTAVTRLSVSIDYNRTGKLEDLEEDRLLGITEDIIHSDSVMEPVFAKASDDDYQTFFARTRTTRTNETWSLAVTGKDPEETAELSVIWLDSAWDALMDALRHAISAESWQNELDGLTRCIQDTARTASPAGCPDDPEEISARIDDYAQNIREELQASRGLSTAIRIGSKDPSQTELRPASRSAAADTMLGAFCGLLAAFALCWFPKGSGQK